VPMTLAEINLQEKYDAYVYGANKSMFETLLRQVVDMEKGPARREKIRVLLESYNNMADSCMRQSQQRRLWENGHK